MPRWRGARGSCCLVLLPDPRLKILAADYRFSKEIFSRGDMTVSKWQDKSDRDVHVVVKSYEAWDIDEDDYQHFKNECRCMALVSPHPNVITFHAAYANKEVT